MRFTRDGFIWALLAVAGGASFLLDHFGLVHDAFPAITPTWHARIELASMIAGWLGAYLRLSPLPLSWDHPLASNDSDTTLSPFNSKKPITLLVAVLALGVSTVAASRYYPETIDSLQTSTHSAVQVAGTVTAVSVTQAGQITFRLRDSHGHTIGCGLGPTLHDQPRVGVEVIVSGQRQRYTPADRPPVVEIDPVEILEPVER